MPASNFPSHRPRIAISVGEVTGVGPELSLRCAAHEAIYRRCIPILLGPARMLSKISASLGLVMPPTICRSELCTVDQASVLDCGGPLPEETQSGRYTAETGQASFAAVELAIEAALSGEVDAVVTGPIQKEAWHAAGIRYAGHTELFADRTGAPEHCMMLTSDVISCVLATIHIPLAEVAEQLSTTAILRAIRLGGDAVGRRLGREPRISVCGLNPHAGENGLFSHGEERDIIEPAIAQARAEGATVVGPLPPDTAFTPAWRARTDLYVCMYHDQGLIPLKALAFDDAINVTLGLPIVRTSVDHGTAVDLAWQGTASDRSMLSAIHLAIDLCRSGEGGKLV